MLRAVKIEHFAGDHFEIAFGTTMPATQIAAIETDHDRRSHRIDVGICGSLGAQPRDALADAAGSIAHCASVDRAADGQQFRKQIGDLGKRRERGELGSHIGEFGRHAAFKRQHRKTSWFLGEFTALAADEPTNSKRHVAEEGSKRDGSISLAGQGQLAMRTVFETLAHCRRLRANHFGLDRRGNLLSLDEGQAERFGNSPILSFDLRHFDLRCRSSAKIGHKLHAPHQFLHSPASQRSRSLAIKN